MGTGGHGKAARCRHDSSGGDIFLLLMVYPVASLVMALVDERELNPVREKSSVSAMVPI